jgi:hypothetical protein
MRKRVYGMLFNLYNNFILLSTQNQKKYAYVLFDITKGRLQGKIVVPRTDICYMDGYYVILGWHGKIVIACGHKGVKHHATIYDTIESNLTGHLNLILRNGISIPLRYTTVDIMINKGGDVYAFSEYNVFAYRLQTRYQPDEHKIRHTRLIRDRRNLCKYRLDIWSDILYLICVPGPVAIAFLNLCDPVNGITRKRSSNNIFRELIPSFHPPNKNPDTQHFYFSDGSLLHLIRNPKKTANVKEHLSSVDIYMRMRS